MKNLLYSFILVLLASPLALGAGLVAPTSNTTSAENAAGIYNYVTPNNEITVRDIPHQLLEEGFETALDTVNRWNTPTTSGGATMAVSSNSLTVSLSTTTGSYAYDTTQPSFNDPTPGQIRFAYNIQLEATPFIASTYRFWGAGTLQAAPSTAGCPACTNTLVNGVGFELNTDQHLYAVSYKGGTRTAIADITTSAPADGATHNYSIFWRPVKAHWFIDSQEVPVATGSFTATALGADSLPACYAAVQGGTTAASILSNTMSVSDTAKNNNTISDGVYGWRKAYVDSVSNGLETASAATSNPIGLSQSVITVNTTTGIKASAGNIYGLSFSNAAASVCYLQFYNSNAPTCGTSVLWSIALPPTPGVVNLMSDIPLGNFSTGIGTCTSTTATGGTTCGSTVSGTVFYK